MKTEGERGMAGGLVLNQSRMEKMRKVEAGDPGVRRHPGEGSCGQQSLLRVSRGNAKQTDRFLRGMQHSQPAYVSFSRLSDKSVPRHRQGQHFERCLFTQLLPVIHRQEAPIDIANCQR